LAVVVVVSVSVVVVVVVVPLVLQLTARRRMQRRRRPWCRGRPVEHTWATRAASVWRRQTDALLPLPLLRAQLSAAQVLVQVLVQVQA
jgi:hypothetical protein